MVSIPLANMKDRFSFFILCMVTLSSLSSTTNADSPCFDVMNYGALGDGKTDDSQAFLKAWNETCKVQSQNATLNIPTKTFLLNPVIFSGPCAPTRINVQLAGKIIANTDQSLHSDDHWLCFSHVKGLALTGNGTMDGQGAGSWEEKNTRVTALKFNYCEDLELEGLTHINPQKSHISLHNCDGANVSNITTSAPEDSPNTDGIDISCSNHVQIQGANIGTGDDCIAINSKCSFINITNITCGLGHGISIGSLGDPTEGTFDTVSKVYVQSCNFTRQNTTGVRIKTWQGGHGEVKNITYQDITFNNIARPIVIDQFYCPDGACKHNNNTNTSALAISNVSYTRISGTSSRDEVVSLLCSDKNSCTNIVLDDVHIKSSDPSESAYANCLTVNGTASDVQPSADKCLSS